MSVDDIISGMDRYASNPGKANNIALLEGISIIDRFTSAILGVLIVISSMGLTLVITVELMYINFPYMQYKIDDIHGRLKGKAQKVFGLAIRDGQLAMKRSTESGYSESVNWVYLKIKAKTLFAFGITLGLVLGPGKYILGQVWDLVSGVVDVMFG